MIRKLTENDRNEVLQFLSVEPSINLFIIGDIEAFGFEESFQELWGQFNINDELEGVLLHFNENYIPYFIKSDFDITGFKEIILADTDKVMVSGKESILKRFLEFLPNHTAKATYFCELTNRNQLEMSCESDFVKVATEDDAERVYNFIENIDEFNGADNYIDRIAHKIRTKTGRVYYIENDKGEMISVVQTTAENTKSAMVVGVASLKEYRGKGYMSKCLTKLCLDILSESKTLCLFYDNPKAGRVYHKLGFKTIDNWVMIKENEVKEV